MNFANFMSIIWLLMAGVAMHYGKSDGFHASLIISAVWGAAAFIRKSGRGDA